jgi:hypothetical protein
MPFNANEWDQSKFVSYQEMLGVISTHFENVTGDGPMEKMIDERTSTTKVRKEINKNLFLDCTILALT